MQTDLEDVAERQHPGCRREVLDRKNIGVALLAFVAFELPSPEAQVNAAAAGLGLAFVSRNVAASDLPAKRIVAVRVEGLRRAAPAAPPDAERAQIAAR